MKALVFTGPGAVEVLDVPEPEVAEGEVLVHVRSAGICGSELHGVRHPGFRVPPLIMGHEFTGVSDAGDPVIINPILSCGSCDLCLAGQRQICRQRAIIGVHRPGGFAERVAVPASALRPLPGACRRTLPPSLSRRPTPCTHGGWPVEPRGCGPRCSAAGPSACCACSPRWPMVRPST